MQVLVTGASGFIGRSLCEALERQGHAVRAVVRSAGSAPGAAGPAPVIVPDLGAAPPPAEAFSGVDAVIHLAGLSQVSRDGVPGADRAYHQANVEATGALARAARHAGVPRFVFLSSIRVFGLPPPAVIGPQTPAAPSEAYGASKLAAEEALAALVPAQAGVATGTAPWSVTALRIPAVYGPGVKGGMLQLLRWIGRGWPLPLGAVRAPRSLLGVENLCAALIACAAQQPAGFSRYILADRETVSLSEVIDLLARGMGRAARNLAVPPQWIGAACRALGKEAAWKRLAEACTIDSGAFNQAFGFTPPVSAADGLLQTGQWYAAADRSGDGRASWTT
jgi:nucleoside-diphosphate-sugar epimerase